MSVTALHFSTEQQDLPRAELSDDDMARSIGRILRELRKQRALSLNDFAKLSGVSRSMLSQIENGRSTPTIAVLWKIAKTMEVPVNRFMQDWESPPKATLMRGQETPLRLSADGQCAWRTLKPADPKRNVEFYEITLHAGGIDVLPPRPEGSWANLAVISGAVVVDSGHSRLTLRSGDTLQFPLDSPHDLINQSREAAVMVLVISHGKSSGDLPRVD